MDVVSLGTGVHVGLLLDFAFMTKSNRDVGTRNELVNGILGIWFGHNTPISFFSGLNTIILSPRDSSSYATK